MTWRPYTIIMLLTIYGIVVMATIVIHPFWPDDQALTVITLSVVAAEVHYVLRHERLQWRRFVKLPLSTLLISMFLSAGVIVWRPLYYRLLDEQREQVRKELTTLAEENRRKEGLFNEDGWILPALASEFELSIREAQATHSSTNGRALQVLDSAVFTDVLAISELVIQRQYFIMGTHAAMAEHFSGFQQRVIEYLDALPRHFRSIERELMAAHNELSASVEIEERRRRLQSLYDSLSAHVRHAAPLLEKDVLDIAHILSQPSYWNIAADPPTLMNYKIKRWRSNANTRATRALRIIQQSRRGFRAYHALLQRSIVSWP